MLIIENKLKKSQIEAIMNGLYKHSLVVPHYYDILKPLKRMVTSKALYFSKVASNGRIGDSILYDAAAQNGVDILKLKTIGDDIVTTLDATKTKFVEEMRKIIPFDELLMSMFNRKVFGNLVSFNANTNYVLSGVDIEKSSEINLLLSKSSTGRCIIISNEDVVVDNNLVEVMKYEDSDEFIESLMKKSNKESVVELDINDINKIAEANTSLQYEVEEEGERTERPFVVGDGIREQLLRAGMAYIFERSSSSRPEAA